MRPLANSVMVSLGWSEAATALRQTRYSSLDIVGKLPASKRRSTISRRVIPGRTRSVAMPHLGITAVADDAMRVEEAQALRHIVERRIKAGVLLQQSLVQGIERAVCPVELPVCSLQASGMSPRRPDVGDRDGAHQQAAGQYQPGTGVVGGRWPSRDRRCDECPPGVADRDLARPVQAGCERRSRLCFDPHRAPARDESRAGTRRCRNCP